MAQRFIVIGLGRFGYHLAIALSQNGGEVVAIDDRIELVEEIKSEVLQTFCMDTSKEENLQSIALDESDIAIVTIGEDHLENSILTTALLAQIGLKRLIARASNKLHARILSIVGADEVINPEKDLAERMGQYLTHDGIIDTLPFAGEYALSEIHAPSSFVGKSINRLQVRQKYGITIVGIQAAPTKKEDGKEVKQDISFNPPPNTLINEGDILICVGSIENIEKAAEE